MKLTVTIPPTTSNYTIEIARGGIFDLNKLKPYGSTFAIICDEHTKNAFATKLQKLLQDAGLQAHVFSFTAGEQSKSRETKAMIEDQMFHAGLSRDVCVVGLGGGV